MRILAAVVLAMLLALPSCGGDLQIKGSLERVVGETVTLALVSGEPTFNGQLSLRAPDLTMLDAGSLQANRKDDRTLSFLIPAGIAAGHAVAVVGQNGGGTYEVPLRISRLAVVLEEGGSLEAWPLSPSSLPRAGLPTGTATGARLALSPTGGELAVAAGDEVRLLALGAEIRDIGAGIKQSGVLALSAGPAGKVLVATAEALILFQFTRGEQTTQAAVNFKDIRALAIDATGESAVVLYGCDTDTDGIPDAACLEKVLLSPSLSRDISSRVPLGAGPQASVLAVSRDGKGVVVADDKGIHGLYAAGATPRKSTVGWSVNGSAFTGAQPVGADRAGAVVSGQDVDLFAVAERSQQLVDLVAFNPAAEGNLQRVGTMPLAEPPSRLSYGRRTLLYIATGKSLLSVDVGLASPTVNPVAEVTPASNISGLVVQP